MILPQRDQFACPMRAHASGVKPTLVLRSPATRALESRGVFLSMSRAARRRIPREGATRALREVDAGPPGSVLINALAFLDSACRSDEILEAGREGTRIHQQACDSIGGGVRTYVSLRYCIQQIAPGIRLISIDVRENAYNASLIVICIRITATPLLAEHN